MRESGTFLALFLGITFDVVNAWEPPPYGSVGSNQCLTNNYNPDTYTMVKSYFDKDLAIKYCEITPGCNIVVKIDRSGVRNFQVGKNPRIGSQNIFRACNKSTKSVALIQHHVNTKMSYRALSLIKFGQFCEKVFQCI